VTRGARGGGACVLFFFSVPGEVFLGRSLFSPRPFLAFLNTFLCPIERQK